MECAVENELGTHIWDRMREAFSEAEHAEVARLLLEIRPEHVMAGSRHNLDAARGAVVSLAKGELKEVAAYAECARKDFRDVIYWVSLDEKKCGPGAGNPAAKATDEDAL